MPDRYRVGHHLGRTIYRDDQLIGIMDHPEDAAKIVKLLNLRDKLADEIYQARGRMLHIRRQP